LNTPEKDLDHISTDNLLLYIFDEDEAAGFRVIRYYKIEEKFND